MSIFSNCPLDKRLSKSGANTVLKSSCKSSILKSTTLELTLTSPFLLTLKTTHGPKKPKQVSKYNQRSLSKIPALTKSHRKNSLTVSRQSLQLSWALIWVRWKKRSNRLRSRLLMSRRWSLKGKKNSRFLLLTCKTTLKNLLLLWARWKISGKPC